MNEQLSLPQLSNGELPEDAGPDDRRNGDVPVDGCDPALGGRDTFTVPISTDLSDYGTPLAVHDEEELIWNEGGLLGHNYAALGRRLAAAGDLYRRPGYADGLLLVSTQPRIGPIVVDTPRRLAAIVADRVRVRVMKAGKARGNHIPYADLGTVLGTELFLQQFRPVDAVVMLPHYLPDFTLLKPGYNDAGPGQRTLCLGPEACVEQSSDAITAFLDVMDFASNADRTNAVALALTVLLRNFWPGGKPVGVVTSTKSHGGKDTVIAFAAGGTPKISVDYQPTDWAFRQSLVGALRACPEAGVVAVENARLGRREQFITAATLERILTDPEPTLDSSKVRNPLTFRNYLVFAVSTNEGTVSEDLMNRGLPIRLEPVGNVADRESPIGNPKLEYLPAHRERIEAELRGMVETWKEAGRPLDSTVRHPFTDWARTVGGILAANGFHDFLGNYSLRRTADDPVRRALGQLGAARPGEWLRPDAWARLADDLGLVRQVVPENDRDTDRGRERGIGVVLTAHRDETFTVDTDDEQLSLRLERRRARFDGGPPTTRYRFVVLGRSPVPEDPEPGDATPT
jgi:hypothetical protein